MNHIPTIFRKASGLVLKQPYLNVLGQNYRIAHSLLSDNIEQLQEAVCYEVSPYRNKVQPMKPSINYHDFKEIKDDKHRMMLHDMLTYLPDDILVKVDRAGMAVSLENRVPMLDRDVISFACSLPMEYKYNQNESKIILKELVYQYVPKHLLDRPKKGFSVPIEKWLMQGEIYEMAKDYLFHSELAKDGILDQKMIITIWNRFQRTKLDKSLVWKLFMLEQWYRSN